MSTTPPDREEDREAMAEAHWDQQLTNAYAEGRKDEREECMSTKAPALLTDERIADLWDKYVGWPTPRIPLLPKDVRAFAKVIEAEVRTLAAAEQQEPVAWACFKPSGEIEPDLVSPSKEDCEFWSSHEPDANWSILPLYAAPLLKE